MTATAAKGSAMDPYAGTALANPDAAAVDEIGISKRDITQIYVSSHPYCEAFEVELDLQKFHCYDKPTAGMKFKTDNGRLILAEWRRALRATKSLDGAADYVAPGIDRLETQWSTPEQTLSLLWQHSALGTINLATWSSHIPPSVTASPILVSPKSTLISSTPASCSAT